jgi:hypothetical protein
MIMMIIIIIIIIIAAHHWVGKHGTEVVVHGEHLEAGEPEEARQPTGWCCPPRPPLRGLVKSPPDCPSTPLSKIIRIPTTL